VHHLMDVMQRLVDKGNSILVIEHNLDVIRCADWIVDLGPEAGLIQSLSMGSAEASAWPSPAAP
jgi:excinuclease UvrABC ATPase subunit